MGVSRLGLALPLALLAAACALRASPEPAAPRGPGRLVVELTRSRTGLPIPGTVAVSGPDGLRLQAVAGADGVADLRGIPLGVPFTLACASPGLLEHREQGLVLLPSETATSRRVPLGGGVPVAVRVHDEDGQPLPGARLAVRQERVAAGPPGPLPAIATATSGADGRALLAGVPPGRWRLVAVAPGWGDAWREIEVVEGERRAEVLVFLRPGAVLEGRVLDAQGRPAAGAEVSIHRSLGEPALRTGRAEDDGRFRFADLPRDDFGIAVPVADGVREALGWGRVPATAPVELRVPPRGAIHGVVLDDATGDPVAGAAITVWPSRQWSDRGGEFRLLASGPDGRFAIGGLPLADEDRPYEATKLSVHADGFRPEWFSSWFPRAGPQPVPVAPEGGEPRPLVARLRRGAAVVRGVVRTADGRPVARASVWLSQGDPSGDYYPVDGLTDADGSYRLAPTRPETGRLTARAPGMHRAGDEPVFEVPEGGEVVRDLVLVPDSTVEGRMVLADGSPASGFVPKLGGESGAPSAEDGSFSLREVSAGTGVSVSALGPYGEMGTSAPFDVGESSRVTGVVVRVVLPGSASGRVLAPDGSSPKRIQMYVVRQGPDDEPRARPKPTDLVGVDAEVGEDGSFLLEELDAGIWCPVVWAPGFLATEGPRFVVREGERTSGIELFLDRGHSLSGKVLDPKGAPLAGALVLAFDAPEIPMQAGSNLIKPWHAGNADQHAESGPDGGFLITGVRSGRMLICALAPGMAGVVISAPGGAGGLVLRMSAGRAISGTVVDTSGKPVDGAVILAEPGEWLKLEDVPEGAGDPTIGTMDWMRIAQVLGEAGRAPAFSGEDGAFRLEGLCGGTYTLSASMDSARCGPVAVEAGATGVVLRLEPGEEPGHRER